MDKDWNQSKLFAGRGERVELPTVMLG